MAEERSGGNGSIEREAGRETARRNHRHVWRRGKSGERRVRHLGNRGWARQRGVQDRIAGWLGLAAGRTGRARRARQVKRWRGRTPRKSRQKESTMWEERKRGRNLPSTGRVTNFKFRARRTSATSAALFLPQCRPPHRSGPRVLQSQQQAVSSATQVRSPRLPSSPRADAPCTVCWRRRNTPNLGSFSLPYSSSRLLTPFSLQRSIAKGNEANLGDSEGSEGSEGDSESESGDDELVNIKAEGSEPCKLVRLLYSGGKLDARAEGKATCV